MQEDDPKEPEGIDPPVEDQVDDDPSNGGDQQDEGPDTTSDPQLSDEPTGGRAARREDSLRDLIEENRRSREAVERARAELDAERNRYSQPDPRVEQERIAQMDPESRLRHETQQSLNQLRQENLGSQFRTAAQIDKMSFESKYGSSAHFRKHDAEIEKQYQSQFQNAWRQGRPDYLLSREVILKQLVGDDVVTNGEKALKAARDTGQRNIQRQTTRAGNVSGNVRPSKSQDNAAEAALKRMRAAGVLEE